MQRILITILLAAVSIYVALCAVLFFVQRSLIYLPQARSRNIAAPLLSLPSEEGAVLVSTRAVPGPRAVIYFGGNAEDVSLSLPQLTAAFPGCALYLQHYRGYGGSAGHPTETALFADAIALFDTVHAVRADVTVIGRSLGSGVAAYLASRRPVSRLILVTPYHSIVELGAAQFPYFPVRWLARDQFESWKYAPAIMAPTLLIQAEQDEVIPAASTQALFNVFKPGVATLRVIRGVGHNTISESAQYLPLLAGVAP